MRRNYPFYLKFYSYSKSGIFILFLSIFLNPKSLAFEPAIINDKSEEFHINAEHLLVLEDPEGKINFEEISTGSFNHKFLPPSPDISLKVNTYFWAKFQFVNRSHQNKNWILQLPLHSNRVELFIRKSDGTVEKYSTGQDLNFETRPIEIRTLSFELPPENEKAVEVFIHLYTKKYTDLSFIISNERRYLEVHTKGYLFLGLIYGILFLMAIYNLILFISIRGKIYIYYVLYTLSAIFFISWKDGLGFQLIWPELPELNDYHYNTGLFFMLISFLLFANDFLELRKNKPRLIFVTYAIILANLIYFIFNILKNAFFEPLPVLYLLSYLYVFILTAYFLINNFKPAWYLLVSLICIIGALGVIKLRYMNLLGWNWFIEYILNYAVAAEAVIMSLAISHKLRYLRHQEEKIKEARIIEEKLKAENEKIQLSHKSLEEDIRHSNNELTLLTTNLIQKTEFLNRFKKEIQSILKENPENNSLQKLLKNLDKEMELENEWDKFRINFDKEHSSFLHRMQEKYPHLKASDLLLSAYIKLNKSNKEIASLLNITVSGVEKKRTRLKEKMQLPSDDSLTEYILKMN